MWHVGPWSNHPWSDPSRSQFRSSRAYPTDGHVSLLCSRVVRMQYIQYGCPWGMALIGCSFFYLRVAKPWVVGSCVGLICVSRGLALAGSENAEAEPKNRGKPKVNEGGSGNHPILASVETVETPIRRLCMYCSHEGNWWGPLASTFRDHCRRGSGASGEHLKVLSGQDLQFTVDSEFWFTFRKRFRDRTCSLLWTPSFDSFPAK